MNDDDAHIGLGVGMIVIAVLVAIYFALGIWIIH